MKFDVALALLLAATAPLPTNSLKGFLSSDTRLQPQVVAHSLFSMEDEWRSQAELFAECNATLMSDGRPAAACKEASSAFEKSCATVVSAVQQASSGDRSVVTEYMGDICGQAVLEGWRKERCQSLASTIAASMSANNYDNRMSLDVVGLCQNYWSSFAAAETARVAKERAEAEVKRVAREAEEKKLADERAAAEKKAAEAAAVAAKKAAEVAAEKEKQRKVEEAARQEAEAKKKAEEEKQKAEKEAADLKANEELALRKAEEAQHRMEEAKAAAEEARQKRVATAAKVNATTATIAPVANSTVASKAVVAEAQNATNATQSANATKAAAK